METLDAKSRYALLAAVDLAEHYDGSTPTKVREIAARTQVSPKYLVHILLELKHHALVNSTRGPKGGYWLLRRPELISAAEVLQAVAPDGEEPSERPSGAHAETIARLYRRAERQRLAYLSRVSLADLLTGELPT